MNVLKKYTWLVGTLMRASDKGLTLEQIADRWNATDELHEEGAFARRSFHRHRSEILDLFGIEVECYMDGGQYRYRLADDGGREYFRQWMMDSIAVHHVVADSREAAQYIMVEATDSRILPALFLSPCAPYLRFQTETPLTWQHRRGAETRKPPRGDEDGNNGNAKKILNY